MPEICPIELAPPDIAPLRVSNTGVDYVHVLDSGQAGPNVMVQAITHGNEICGAIALCWLWAQAVRPRRGKLTLALANVAAFSRFDPQLPHKSRFVDEDYNRVWGDDQLSGPRDSVELRRARALQPFVDAADFLLDIHSMNEACRPIMVCGQCDKNADFARQLGAPADLLIDTGHPAGLRMVERGGFGDPASPRRALLVECGQHTGQAGTLRPGLTPIRARHRRRSTTMATCPAAPSLWSPTIGASAGPTRAGACRCTPSSSRPIRGQGGFSIWR